MRGIGDARNGALSALAVRALVAGACALVALAPAAMGEIRASRDANGTVVLRSVSTRVAKTRRPRTLREAPEVISKWVEEYARSRGLDPKLVQAMIQVESDYDAGALSHKGAMGLMQLMPDTARELGVSDPWDPADNLRGGTAYLRRLLDRFDGDLELALAGYNAGPEAVTRHQGVPPYPETADYVERVLSLYRGETTVLQRQGVRARPSGAAAERPVGSPAPAGRTVQAHRDSRGQLVLTTQR